MRVVVTGAAGTIGVAGASAALVDALKALPPERRPRTLLSQSATGYYGAADGVRSTRTLPLGTASSRTS